MNRISVTVITLNEERNLPRLLASLGDVADEIVVADCGSADHTGEIAAAEFCRGAGAVRLGAEPRRR
jgi:glycosyltransferase involved in cell wall biosynthesis